MLADRNEDEGLSRGLGTNGGASSTLARDVPSKSTEAPTRTSTPHQGMNLPLPRHRSGLPHTPHRPQSGPWQACRHAGMQAGMHAGRLSLPPKSESRSDTLVLPVQSQRLSAS